ncbi:hypothetical protein RND71_017271 [Anisodus tanguticus]|uniref:Uncharacterized protein n=1 Tax=Anisodus tanguticus TaxID=243964 RepID=A0AAE1S228_9SOLA|nr:hypothetical protein RND71_017271 [Anisodus tanguticus]
MHKKARIGDDGRECTRVHFSNVSTITQLKEEAQERGWNLEANVENSTMLYAGAGPRVVPEDIVELEETTTDNAGSPGSSVTPDNDHISNTYSEELSTDSDESPNTCATHEN